MTDKTTELLRKLLDERGIEWRSGLDGVTFVGDWCFVEYDNGKLAATCEPVLTPEHAVAATLGMSNESVKTLIDDMLDFINNCCKTTIDFGCCDPIDCKYLGRDGELAECTRYQDFLSRAKAIAATLEHSTLIAEQVRKAVERHGNIMDNRLYEDWQAVADELNAELGRR